MVLLFACSGPSADSSLPPPAEGWVRFGADDYEMGSPPDAGLETEHPRHLVALSTFDLMKTEVTQADYAACVEAGECEPPVQDQQYCLYGRAGEEDYPVVCVTRKNAEDHCFWRQGRLPSEAEWEYAARSGGREQLYPWGDEEPTCTRAVIDEGGVGCGTERAAPVCSRPDGNSAQGLCDLAGNLWEWTADRWHDSYEGAPDGGRPWEEGQQDFWVIRGGGIGSDGDFRAFHRLFHPSDFQYGGLGFRCAATPEPG
ncbi:MAG TPA: formylglycine-generating enzyme family protein [Myxococcota bacterium]|nr:formylglycine-generating enzyme family protein [Myxococcota bacterium]HNH48792.1 formylglycine-generating enzyme family protein [Myxococcota bacterium]